MESESAEHDLHCFQAWRRMDEILVANFMLFHDVIQDDQYDLWIGDEAWELDYYLHENPEQSGLPTSGSRTSSAGCRCPTAASARLSSQPTTTRDDRAHRPLPAGPRPALFVGTPDDIVADRFGPGLPLIREWTRSITISPAVTSRASTQRSSRPRALAARAGYRRARRSAS